MIYFKNKLILIVILIIILLSSILLVLKYKKSKPIEIIPVDRIVANDINIPEYEKEYVGELRTVNKKPYKIYSGRSCNECDENISLYVYSESDKNLENTPRYSYPGKRYSIFNDSETIDFNSRVFFGNCLSNNSQEIIWFQRQLQDNGKYLESIYGLEVVNDELQEKTYEYDENLFKNKGENCKEIPGIDVSVEQ